MKQMKKLGPLENLIKMIPGAKKMGLTDVKIDPKQMAHIEAIVLSMTPKERRNPDIIKASRKTRIAAGSGTKLEDVNRLMKQFDQTRKMMRMITGMGSSKMAQMANAMKAMKGGMPKF
jgi:signal recognition particle subunit SRP54